MLQNKQTNMVHRRSTQTINERQQSHTLYAAQPGDVVSNSFIPHVQIQHVDVTCAETFTIVHSGNSYKLFQMYIGG